MSLKLQIKESIEIQFVVGFPSIMKSYALNFQTASLPLACTIDKLNHSQDLLHQINIIQPHNRVYRFNIDSSIVISSFNPFRHFLAVAVSMVPATSGDKLY